MGCSHDHTSAGCVVGVVVRNSRTKCIHKFSGDVNYRPRRERPFAPQKAGFVPLEDIFGPARGRIIRELTRPLVVHSVSPAIDKIFRPECVQHYLNTIG